LLLHWLFAFTLACLLHAVFVYLIDPTSLLGWVVGSAAVAIIGFGDKWMGKVELGIEPLPAACLCKFDQVMDRAMLWLRPIVERPLLYLLSKSQGLLLYATPDQLLLLRKEFQEIQQTSLPVPASEPAQPTRPAAVQESDWTITVPLLVKRAAAGAPALYFPHKVWFEPDSKRLYWQASGDDVCLCDVVQSAKVLNRVAMTLQIALATRDAMKVLKFKDAGVFKSWTDRLLAVLNQTA
jgi:hypothetical protein